MGTDAYLARWPRHGSRAGGTCFPASVGSRIGSDAPVGRTGAGTHPSRVPRSRDHEHSTISSASSVAVYLVGARWWSSPAWSAGKVAFIRRGKPERPERSTSAGGSGSSSARSSGRAKVRESPHRGVGPRPGLLGFPGLQPFRRSNLLWRLAVERRRFPVRRRWASCRHYGGRRFCVPDPPGAGGAGRAAATWCGPATSPITASSRPSCWWMIGLIALTHLGEQLHRWR